MSKTLRRPVPTVLPRLAINRQIDALLNEYDSLWEEFESFPEHDPVPYSVLAEMREAVPDAQPLAEGVGTCEISVLGEGYDTETSVSPEALKATIEFEKRWQSELERARLAREEKEAKKCVSRGRPKTATNGPSPKVTSVPDLAGTEDNTGVVCNTRERQRQGVPAQKSRKPNIARPVPNRETESDSEDAGDDKTLFLDKVKKDYKGTRCRGWFFTLNNYSEEEVNILKDKDRLKWRYLVYQEELGCGNGGQSEGTPHLQGFLYYTNAVVWPKRFLTRAHFEPARVIGACINYCKKERTRVAGPFEFGEIPEQGRRKDLEEAAANYLKLGPKEFAKQDPGTFIRYHKGLQALREVTFEHRKGRARIEWRWGPTGVGKSYVPFEIKHGLDKCFIKDETKWWSDYAQEEAIVIDDFDGSWPYRNFLRLIDKYKISGEKKGTHIAINSPFIYITCEYPPEKFWSGHKLAQVVRRISQITHVVAQNDEIVMYEGDPDGTDTPWFDYVKLSQRTAHRAEKHDDEIDRIV